jgi:hypothetical protein
LILLTISQNVHVRGAARVLDVSPSELTAAVTALERIGVVVSQLVGSTRILALNRRWYAAAELRVLLERMGEADAELSAYVESQRARPRRIGKPL